MSAKAVRDVRECVERTDRAYVKAVTFDDDVAHSTNMIGNVLSELADEGLLELYNPESTNANVYRVVRGGD